jgi:hypothetical protein
MTLHNIPLFYKFFSRFLRRTDVNYILAERSREYYGEGYRWFDLVRTQKWAEIAHTYTICGSTKGDHTPKTFTRIIEPHHYLRPIP